MPELGIVAGHRCHEVRLPNRLQQRTPSGGVVEGWLQEIEAKAGISAVRIGLVDDDVRRPRKQRSKVGGDGFLIRDPVTRKNITEICYGLAPQLRKRGLIRSGYTYDTFRENLLEF